MSQQLSRRLFLTTAAAIAATPNLLADLPAAVMPVGAPLPTAPAVLPGSFIVMGDKLLELDDLVMLALNGYPGPDGVAGFYRVEAIDIVHKSDANGDIQFPAFAVYYQCRKTERLACNSFALYRFTETVEEATPWPTR